MNGLWTKNANGSYSALARDMRREYPDRAPVPCPNCGERVWSYHLGKTDTVPGSRDRLVLKWHFSHPCGARLTVINQ
jgi:hypothetical protein